MISIGDAGQVGAGVLFFCASIQGKGQEDSGAVTGRRIDLDTAVMEVDDPADEGQAQAATGGLGGQLDAELEGPVDLTGGHSDSVVFNLAEPLVFLSPGGDRDPAGTIGGEKLQCVVHQFHEDPREQVGVGATCGQLSQFDPDAGLLDPFVERIQDAFHERLHVHICDFIDPAGGDKQVGDVGQFGDLRGQVRQFGIVGCGLELVQQAANVVADHREERFKVGLRFGQAGAKVVQIGAEGQGRLFGLALLRLELFLQAGHGLVGQVEIVPKLLDLTEIFATGGLRFSRQTAAFGLGNEQVATSMGQIGFEPLEFVGGLSNKGVVLAAELLEIFVQMAGLRFGFGQGGLEGLTLFEILDLRFDSAATVVLDVLA